MNLKHKSKNLKPKNWEEGNGPICQLLRVTKMSKTKEPDGEKWRQEAGVTVRLSWIVCVGRCLPGSSSILGAGKVLI